MSQHNDYKIPFNLLCGGRHSVCLGIIAEKPEIFTLTDCLRSHRAAKIYTLFSNVLMFYRGIDMIGMSFLEEINHPRKIELPENLSGIERMEIFVREAKTDYVVLLDYNFLPAVDLATLVEYLEAAIDGIENGVVNYHSLTDFAMLRAMNAGRKVGRHFWVSAEPAGFDPVLDPQRCLWRVPGCLAGLPDTGVVMQRKWFQQELIPALKREHEASSINLHCYRNLAEVSEYSRWWLEAETTVGMFSKELFAPYAPVHH